MAIPTWIEYGVELPALVTTDSFPLWLRKDDSFEFYADPTGKTVSADESVLLPLKFYLDSNLDKLSLFATASNGTYILKIIQGAKLATANKVVTDEEDIELSINIKDEAFSTGDALLEVIARGNFNVKINKIAGFYLAGWDEFSPPATTWTEGS